MNIAIFGSGQCRKLNTTQLNKAFSLLSPDQHSFYFHTWEDDINNPNWKRLHNFFPNALIKTEKYTDNFDNYSQIRLMESIDFFRYNFAQFYTVLNSFKMFRFHKEYDFFIRTRTDISYQTDLLDFLNEKDPANMLLRRWTWHALKQTIDKDIWREMGSQDLNTLLVNKDEVDSSVLNLKPIIWSRIKMCDPKFGISFDDFSWVMNPLAFKLLSDLDVALVMRKAIEMKVDNAFNIQSPVIWSSIFKDLGITIIDAPLSGQIKRARAEDQNLVTYYGDIT